MLEARHRGLALSAAALTLTIVAASSMVACGDRQHSREIESDEVLEDLGYVLGAPTSRVPLHTAPRAPARLGWVASGRVGHRITVPPDAVLRIEFAVGAPSRVVPTLPARFTATVDGAEVLATTLAPATVPRDRRWHRHRVDLGALAGREVDFALAATPTATTGTGMPAWSRLELVRVHRAPRQRAAAGRPNVLLVLVDTLRADVVGCYGARPSPSPTLDALAASGLRFEDTVAPAPWTLPSVSSIFTGRYPRKHGVTVRLQDGATADSDGGTYLGASIPTLATLAQRAGITTYASVANALLGPDTGLSVGFGRFERPSPGTERRFPSGHQITSQFLAWAKRHRDVRFFAYLHYMEMHSPYAPRTRPSTPAESALVRAGDATALSRIVRRGGRPPLASELAHLKALYTRSLSDWDAMLSELLRGLDELGLRDDTIVIVTADHGEEFLEHGQLGHAKQLFEESLRVPLIIAGPRVPIGRRLDTAQLVDLLPTVTTILGAARPANLVGRDLLATAASTRPAFAEVRGGVGFGSSDATLAMVREPPWKLIWAPELGRTALFNLRDNPDELGGDPPDPAVVDRLLAAGRRYWSHGTQRAEVRYGAPDVNDRLRSLGYIE